MEVVRGAVSSIGAEVPNEQTDDQHEAAVAEVVAEIERNLDESDGLIGNIEANWASFNQFLESVIGGSDDDGRDAIERANERTSRDSE